MCDLGRVTTECFSDSFISAAALSLLVLRLSMVPQVLITCVRSETPHTPHQTHTHTMTLHTTVFTEAFNMNVIKLSYIFTGNISVLIMYTFYDKAVQTGQNRSEPSSFTFQKAGKIQQLHMNPFAWCTGESECSRFICVFMGLEKAPYSCTHPMFLIQMMNIFSTLKMVLLNCSDRIQLCL